MKHEYVCLLQHLGAGGTRGAEEEVCGDRPPRSELFDDEWFELEEASELLVDAARALVAVDKRVGDRQPARSLCIVDLVERRGLAEVPAREHVRERVVVDGLVILVRTDHPVDVRSAIASKRTRDAQ